MLCCYHILHHSRTAYHWHISMYLSNLVVVKTICLPKSPFFLHFIKSILAITFLLLLISSWNFHNACQLFLYNQEQNFSRQKTKNMPLDLHYKNRQLWYVTSMTFKNWAIFIIGVYGQISHFLSDLAKFSFLGVYKRWHTSWKFQLKKKVIAKKPLTNLYEMKSRVIGGSGCP